MARQIAWMKDHINIDPATLIAKIKGRVLVCQGEKDFQVSVRDSERLCEAAKAAGVEVTCKVFPNLDHLFKYCEGESTQELYYDRTRRVDSAFKAFVLSWMRR
jgi:dipeptidyl aminopeptidase/acylaminoacyl peptidase